MQRHPAPVALVVTAEATPADLADRLGLPAYSYTHAYRAFRPLLERVGTVIEVERGESRLDAALHAARQRGLQPLHVSFLPLQLVYPSSLAPTVAFPFWEFPDIPNSDFDDNPRNNWLRVSAALAALACASQLTCEAFRHAGARAPIHLVPPPVADDYFHLPAPSRAGRRLDCPVYLLGPGSALTPAAPRRRGGRGLSGAARAAFDRAVQPRLPLWLDRGFGEIGRVGRRLLAQAGAGVPPPDADVLALDGVVFTSVLNPFDERKNWEDLLSAFLLALGDAADATLVLKLAVCPPLVDTALRLLRAAYRTMGLAHRCRVAIVADYLAPDQMLALTRASTYFVTATRAEGACLPARDFLAAGRPVVAPAHTALADYVDDAVGFVVDSHPEPTHWPYDLSRRLATSWQRIVWQSLHDQIRAAYRTATADPDHYRRLAARGRERLRALAAPAAVWPRLCAALDEARR
jgi:glycosyltransferase involved in cell wall biosynthesis